MLTHAPVAPPPLDADADAAIARALGAHASEPGGLLPVLHAIQDALGWLPPESLPRVASALNLSRADVHGVVSFYPDFRTDPPGRVVVKICRAEACQAMGAEALVEHACQRLGTQMHTTRTDGAVTLEPVYCLGNCALAPAVMVGRTLFGRVGPARFDALVEAVPSSTVPTGPTGPTDPTGRGESR